MDFETAELQYYRRGFEDCAELAEDLVANARDLEGARINVKRMLATLKEKKVAELKAELNL